ncbi:MAG TPA: helix-turn-helix domain-containing protein [Bryobacteraceae bacterium]|nr:helix-turn-helix domain-containing protein [Bryobacteraceae bacterium]
MQLLRKHRGGETRVAAPARGLDELITRVVESDTFRTAPMMRTLLLYLWKHQGEPISEYAIAVDALGRSPDFDPKTDSTVRVQVARLRAKLKEFSEAAGDSFPLRLTIPLGRHELHWVYEPPQISPVSPLAAVPRRYLWTAGGLIAGLLLLCLALLIQNRVLRASFPAPPPPLPRFWKSFLVAGKPTVIVLPSPLYFFWPDHNVFVRDLKISEFENWQTSPVVRDMAQKWGPPTLAQTYVGAMEMTAGVRVLQYLQQGGQQVQLIESRKFPADSFAAQNTIFLGMPRTAVYLDRLVKKTNFYIAQVEPDLVGNRNPKPGEPAEYREVDYSSDRKIFPAIVVLLPTRPEHTRSLLLMGRTLTSMTTMLLSLDGLKLLDEQWIKGGSPESWEMVIEAEVYRDTVLKVWPVSFRAIPDTFWK